MPKYMLICHLDGDTFAKFSDNHTALAEKKLHLECGLGGQGEMYHRVEDKDSGDRYEFWYS